MVNKISSQIARQLLNVVNQACVNENHKATETCLHFYTCFFFFLVCVYLHLCVGTKELFLQQ